MKVCFVVLVIASFVCLVLLFVVVVLLEWVVVGFGRNDQVWVEKQKKEKMKGCEWWNWGVYE